MRSYSGDVMTAIGTEQEHGQINVQNVLLGEGPCNLNKTRELEDISSWFLLIPGSRPDLRRQFTTSSRQSHLRTFTRISVFSDEQEHGHINVQSGMLSDDLNMARTFANIRSSLLLTSKGHITQGNLR